TTLFVMLVVATGASGAVSITPAPKWQTFELKTYPGANWLTVGGNLGNQPYSTLKQGTTANVAGLKEAWHVHLDGSGVAGKYSAEVTPLVYNGVMYIMTGNNDIF